MLGNMNLAKVEGMDLDSVQATLEEAGLPYEISRKKNPLFRWEYLEIRESAFVGIWIRDMDKKNQLSLIPCIPSVFARAFFGGLLFMILFKGARGRLAEKLSEILRARYPEA